MSVTFANGFLAQGMHAGIKSNGNLDLALVQNLGPIFVAAAQFTTNKVKAAPVKWSEKALIDNRLEAVLLNSGGANACTGPEGFQDTHRSAERVAETLKVSAADVAICSTGLIGERLPINKLLNGVDFLGQNLAVDGGQSAARAIMTTDTVPKMASVEFGSIRIGGMAKGAGMLAPSLATMLVVITTDAVIESEEAKSAAEQALYNYAENPDKTSKQVARKPNTLSAATYREVKQLLDEFSVRVVDNATQIRLLVTNKLLLETADPDPRIRIRALELLGKITDVGLFTEKSEVTVINRSTEDLTNSLREKIRRLMRPDNVTDVDAVEVNGEAINVSEELGLPDDENTGGQTENTENSAD